MMKANLTYRLLMMVAAFLALSCSNDDANEVKAQTKNNNMTTQHLYLTIGSTTLTATLADNSSAEALLAALQEAPITYEAHDYGNFEKVGSLGRSFPQNNEEITTVPGDIILYQGTDLCLYYGTNTWNFTRIGKIEGLSQAELKDVLQAGKGNITVTLTATPPTGISKVVAGKPVTEEYAINGTKATPHTKGITISNGTKHFKK